MATTKKEINEVYLETIDKITSSSNNWNEFLKCAGRNYKYPFQDQVLIYAQRPTATAVAEIDIWNERFKRWVKSGTSGIALIRENGHKIYLTYVFDINDTYDKLNKPFSLWQYNRNYDNLIIDTLKNKYSLSDTNNFIAIIKEYSNYLVEDNLYNYINEYLEYKSNSSLNAFSNEEAINIYKDLMSHSITNLILSRLNIDEYYNDFDNIKYFTDQYGISLLGIGCSDLSELAIRELHKSYEMYKNQKYTFEKNKEKKYDDSINEERTDNYENNLYKRRKLHDTRLRTIRENETRDNREIRSNEIKPLEGEQESTIYRTANERQFSGTLDGSTKDSNEENREYDKEISRERELDRGIESIQSDGMGTEDEYVQVDGRGADNTRDNSKLASDNKINNITILATRINEYIRDYYDYNSYLNNNINNQEDLLADIIKKIQEPDELKEIISFFKNALDDYSDEDEFEIISNLIDDLVAYLPPPVYNVGVKLESVDNKKYEITKINQNTIELYDYDSPLFTKELSISEFEELLNDGIYRLKEEDNDYNVINNADSLKISSNTGESKETIILPQKENNIDKEIIKKKNSERFTTFDIHPEIPLEKRNQFVINDYSLGVGALKEKYERNINAIRTLKQIESENRFATKEEQEILSQYVGWGGLADCFDNKKDKWSKEYTELKDLLTENEYINARASTRTSFYTPPIVIKSIYQTLENMGLKSGNILEPSCGIGNFIGMKPDSLDDCKIYGVEIDDISGRIARQLYQKSSIAISGFEKTSLPNNFFDVAIGNVPFDTYNIYDREYSKYNFVLHDYFFAKSLDKVRTGGIVAFITSKGTLDKEDSTFRKYLSKRASLLGAIRLPNNTFKDNAGTIVTTDIIFLQKRDKISSIDESWEDVSYNYHGARINNYFIEHPEMILGELTRKTTQYGTVDYTCVAREDISLEEQLNDAIKNIVGNIELNDYEIEEYDDSIEADVNVKNFSYTIVDNKIYYRQDSRMYLQNIPESSYDRMKSLIGIRDCLRTLIDYQTFDYPEEEIKSFQTSLNILYDSFKKKYGLINNRINASLFSEDSSYYLLCSLEILDDDRNFVRKADMFSKRTIRPHNVINKVDTAQDALILSLSEKAQVDMDYMTNLTGKTEEELASELGNEIFAIPHYNDNNEIEVTYQTADEYLSGNIKKKMDEIEKFSKIDNRFLVNYEMLKKSMPEFIPASDIGVRLGATWVPTDIYNQFMYELLDVDSYVKYEVKVRFSQMTGEWNISNKSYDKGNELAYTTYGTNRVNAYKLLEDSLNLRDTMIYDYFDNPDGKKDRVLNKKETAIAQAKQDLIRDKFKDWVWSDAERRDKLVQIYNDTFNYIKPREYDGSNIKFYGMNQEIKLNPHQQNAVARILFGGNTLLAHEVGAGKTFEMVAAAMESKRLGLCNKSLIIVPKNIKEQFASDFLRLYPTANILIATEKDFSTANRKKFCSKIATGDYDAIIMGHSQFKKIPISIERQEALLQKDLDEIMDAIDNEKASNSRSDNYTVKELEKTRKSIENKLAKMHDQKDKDDVITFEQLGVDKLFVDEAHLFKNLYFYSKMRNVGGIAQTDSQQSSDLYMKCRYLDEITGGKGIVFATGTPICNSMAELYTLQKYLQYDLLEERKLLHFDSWASTFGETVTAMELAPEGTGYRIKTRFAKFYNLPELMAMFREVADIQTADMLNLPVPEVEYVNVAVEPTDIQIKLVESLAERAEQVRGGLVDPKDDNMLKITNDGRKIGLDQRLYDDKLPEAENSKVTICADRVFEVWKNTKIDRLTQLIFCDLSTPQKGVFNVYDDLKNKLLEKGVPEEEISFIHDAKNDAQRQIIFDKVRSGEIRILIGSTSKMGAGTNCQDLLIEEHHLDCPWRPDSFKQRIGRMVRQGNKNKKCRSTNYFTKKTFDAYMYQTLENKQKFIAQVMTSKSPARSMDDIDETALSYAEIKALATDNPLILEKNQLDTDVAKLTLLKQNYLSQKYSLEDKINKSYPNRINFLEKNIDNLKKDNNLFHSNYLDGDAFSMKIKNIIFDKKDEAGTKILDLCHSCKEFEKETEIGEYYGFKMGIKYNIIVRGYDLFLVGNLTHIVSLGNDARGNIIRIDNALKGIEGRISKNTDELTETKRQLEIAKQEVSKPFPQDKELKEKQKRLNKVNSKLKNLDKKKTDDEKDYSSISNSKLRVEYAR